MIEKLEREAAAASAAAEAAAARALAEATTTAEKSAAAATSAAAGSCSLAHNHAKASGVHAGQCRVEATEAENQAAKATDAASRAATSAANLETAREARKASPVEIVLYAFTGLVHADEDFDDGSQRRRGLESSRRADVAATKARAAGETARAAVTDAEKAAGQAQSAAASCAKASRPAGRLPTQNQSVPPRPPGATGQAPTQMPPSFGALPEKPVVAVLAVGDPMMAAPLEATLEQRLLRGGFDVRDELNSLELAALLEKKGADVSMSEVLPILLREGFHVAVMVKVEEGARRRINARGESLHMVAARLRLNAQLLPARRAVGRGWSERVEYTELNAEVKGKQAFIGATTELVPAIRDGWSALRGGG